MRMQQKLQWTFHRVKHVRCGENLAEGVVETSVKVKGLWEQRQKSPRKRVWFKIRAKLEDDSQVELETKLLL